MNIKDVARAAGVSVATVSRVLNHPEQVQPETKQHVLSIMESLHYQPNWFARGLNFGKTGTIALLVPKIEDHRFVEIITGVETIAQKKEHTVLLCNTHVNAQEELKSLNMVLERKVDGLILVSSQLSARQMAPLIQEGCPWVHIGSSPPAPCDHLCFIHYEKGAYQMTAHLLKLGYRSISLLLDSAPLPEASPIIAGYRRALQDHDAPPDREILRCEDSVQGGYLTTQQLIQSGNAPRALITFSDEQAFGALKAAADEGVSIPDQLALACLEDSRLCPIFTPSLTALDLPAHRLGLVAARMLFDCIECDEAFDGPQEIILQPELKIRRSCGNTSPIY